MPTRNSFARLTLIGAALIGIILLAFYAASYIENNAAAQALVQRFGAFGILLLAFVGGLNIVIPIHAATFTPIFQAAGFELTTIILLLAFGTTLADLVSYAMGVWGRRATGENMTRFKEKIDVFAHKRRPLILPGIFLYAAFVPFPNEAILIPLGLMGFRLTVIIIPLILGTLLHQTIFAFGFSSAFDLFF